MSTPPEMPVLGLPGLALASGEIVAVLGGNGSGKTSLLEGILGLQPLSDLGLFGQDASALSVEQRVALGIGYVPAGRRVFAGLTVRENLEAACGLPARDRASQVDAMFALFPLLGERPAARAWLLSGGQQQMLALARAMMNRPGLLLLDEPTLGLAPRIVAELFEALRKLAAGGTAILLAEQRAGLALTVARRGIVLSRGRIVRDASASALAMDPTLSDLMASG
ncbi:MAG TPA: ATP-binding cassette domain-containing protein [Reyranellaceae bacterium]|nr:ATP-binding cassette domain-containing protein [Reyranellaceae bacterium]